MPRLAYQTDLGRGWIEFAGDDAVEISLPGLDDATGAEPSTGADAPPAVARLKEALEAYYSGRADFVPGCRLVRAAGTTPFTRDVYRYVGNLRPTQTVTYGEVARALGRPGAARAVGAAMARNPYPPVIPCHRVVGADGTLQGYGGGLDMKAHLLRMEGALA